MRKTKKKSLFPWKRPQSRCHCVPCYSSVRAGLRNRQKALLMRWAVQIPPSPVKTSTLAIPKGICRDVFFCSKEKAWNPRVALKMRKTKKKSLFPWKRPQSRCHCVPCYSSVRAGLRNRQKALLMRWAVQIPPSPVKTSTLAIPKGICRDVFFCSKEKAWNPRVALKMRKTKKKSLFPWKRPQSRCHCVPCYSSVRAGLRNRQKALLMRWAVQIPPSPVKTSTLAIPKGICRDVFFCFKKKKDGI